jgi:mannose-6-phosphate isomerase class I
MNYKDRVSNYDKEPEVIVSDYDNCAYRGYKDIINEIKGKINKNKYIVTVDCYCGVKDEEVLTNLVEELKPCLVIKSEEMFYDKDALYSLMKRNLTEDRVFGIMYNGSLEDFIDKSIQEKLKKEVSVHRSGLVLIYGVGASLINRGDTLIYADLARWEIQKRFRRKELGNFKANNCEDDTLRKYKRAFFIEWRILDRHKSSIFDSIDYLLDTNIYDDPKLITGDAFRIGLMQATKSPFRVVPFFDPGVWGGEWMQQVCDVLKEEKNLAWGFDCVPEENSLYLKYGNIRVEVPSLNIVLFRPKELLGEKVYARFGAEFPIRFDFLDTINGEKLSLQVHPVTQYIKENFGMNYTQDESYYILDTKGDASVYLGLKDNINKEDMLRDLERANSGEIIFEEEKYINKFEAKKHDHFLIPAGTVHCSGSNTMVLEISATPFIFTFKLWDWGRLGLDGLPRPIHIEHGKKVIEWNRTTNWVKDNLINKAEIITDNGVFREEKTGLHELEFIETRRFWSDKAVTHNTNNNLNVLNLVEGEEAIVESTDGNFEPFVIHYVETFIVPASVGEYTIRPYGKSEGKIIGIIKAYVRF